MSNMPASDVQPLTSRSMQHIDKKSADLQDETSQLGESNQLIGEDNGTFLRNRATLIEIPHEPLSRKRSKSEGYMDQKGESNLEATLEQEEDNQLSGINLSFFYRYFRP